MKRFRRCLSVLFALYILVLIPNLCGASGQKLPSSDPELSGFRGIAWGQHIDSIPHFNREFKFLFSDPTKLGKFYIRKKDSLMYGNVKIKAIEYTFYRDKFAIVDVITKSEKNAEWILQEIVKEYGGAAKEVITGNNDKLKKWVFGDVEIRYIYRIKESECWVSFRFTPLAKEIDQIVKDYNKNANHQY